MRRLLAACLAVCLADTAGAAENARPPEERFANEIRHARNTIESRQNELKWFINDLDGLGDFAKGDLALIREDFARIAAAWQSVADAYRGGEVESARNLQSSAEAMQEAMLWRPRIEARKQQKDLWPADEWVIQLTARWRGPQQRAWAPKFIAARRRASTAWARVAEVLTAGADPRKVIEAEDGACHAEFDSRAAEAVFNSNEDKDRVMHNPKVSSEELTRKLAEIESLEKERIEFAHAQAEMDRKRRDWERRRKAANKALAGAYDAAARELEAGQRKKRP